MLTPQAKRILGFSAALFTAAFILANSILLVASLISMFTVLAALTLENPSGIEIRRAGLKSSAWVGETQEVTVHVRIKGGVGPILILDEIPEIFALAEGNNFKAYWKGIGEKNFSFKYKVKCTKRGRFIIPPVKWEARHVLGLKAPIHGECGEEMELTVSPRIINIRRLRGKYTSTLFPHPVRSTAKIGVSSTDFKEIREYTVGDPVKIINWKATARCYGRLNKKPLVNEYEKEGRQTVWIFINTSRNLEVGTTIENVFEYSVSAAAALSYYFLSRGCRVALTLYGGKPTLLHPETGKRQIYKILKELSRLEAVNEEAKLAEAIEKHRRFILRYDPFCVIVTCLNMEKRSEIVEAVKKLVALRRKGSRKPPVLLLNVLPQDILAYRRDRQEENAKILYYIKTRPLVQNLRAAGLTIVEWNPRRESLANILLRQVKKH